MDVRAEVGGREWYHTIELAPGVVTPGWFDTRPVAARLPWPDLTGRRCLDVGTFDGFWGFEMERRGAAEVLAVDILDPTEWDWPVGADDAVVAAIGARKRGGDGWLTAAARLGSRVERRELSVYDLDPAEVGTFDLVYLGSLLLHLRDPVRALERVREVLRPGGTLLLVDAVDAELSLAHPRSPVVRLDGLGRPWWWKPNKAALGRMVEAAGFSVEQGPHAFLMPFGAGRAPGRVRLRSLRTAAGRQYALEQWRGDPHAWVLARQRPA
ncbi:MAG: class I SAM-dependent methyltransferase [Mycobacteriales bacterium]